MPAILNEAFISPFDKIQGRPQRDEVEETSSDIRNPDFLAAVGERGPGLGGGTPNPFQTNYRVTSAQDPRNGIYNNLNSLTQNSPSPHPPHQSTHTHPHQNHRNHNHGSGRPCIHNCNKLITEILSCDECREKLKGIMRQLELEEQRALVTNDAPDQTGGSPIGDLLKDMDSNVITNIIIGIALLFFIDRIISARLRN